MKLTSALKCGMFLCIISSTPAFSESTPGIETLIRTPASAFDVFLGELYFKLGGQKHFSNSHRTDQFNVFKLDYDYKSNVILIGIHIGPSHERMNGFTPGDLNERRAILLKAAQDTATSLGIAPREIAGIPIRLGLIQEIKIRNGWGTKEFDETKIKNEIADRVELTLVYAWEEKVVYQVRRTISGQYNFSTFAK